MPDTATIPVDQSAPAAGGPNPGATPSTDDERYERAADNFNTDTLVDGMLSTLRQDDAIPVETLVARDEAPAPTPDGQAAPAPGDRGDGRDAHGRFVSPADKAAAAAAATTPAPEAPKDGAPADVVPFQFRFNGQTQAIDGATMDGEGAVHFAKEKLPLVRQAFNALAARGMTDDYIGQLRTQVGTLEQQLQQAAEHGSVEKEQSKTLVALLEKTLMESDDNAFWEKMQDLRARWPQLKLEAENKYLREQSTRSSTKAAPGTTPAAPAAPAADGASFPTPEAALSVSEDWIEERKLDPAFRTVKPDEWSAYQQRLQTMPLAFLRPATAKDVAEFGVTLGELVHDTDLQAADFARFVEAHRKAAQDTAAATKLAADQARRTQPSVEAPPTPGGSPAPARQPGSRPRTPEEWDAYMNDGTTL